MRARRLGVLLFLMVAAPVIACGNGTGGGGGASSSASASESSSGASSSGASASSSGVTTSSGTTSSSSSTGGPAHGACSKPCGAAADCCPPNTPTCPGPSYPDNYTCPNGACLSPQCASTADCAAQNPKLDCFSLGGFPSCAIACAVDTDCTAPLTCIGKDDNAKKYCLSMGSGCTDDASCLGFGKCLDKVCVCDVDADCTKAGFTKCAK